jgi:hypothetical protein
MAVGADLLLHRSSLCATTGWSSYTPREVIGHTNRTSEMTSLGRRNVRDQIFAEENSGDLKQTQTVLVEGKAKTFSKRPGGKRHCLTPM